jgi:hypothetical protein
MRLGRFSRPVEPPKDTSGIDVLTVSLLLFLHGPNKAVDGENSACDHRASRRFRVAPAAPSRCMRRKAFASRLSERRRAEAEKAAEILGAEIEFFDACDYPLYTTPEMFDRTVDIYRELNPSFVLTQALERSLQFRSSQSRAFRAGDADRRPGDGAQTRRHIHLFRAAGLLVRAAPA